MTSSLHPRIPEGFPNERLSLLPGKLIDALANHSVAQRLYPTRIGFFPEASGHFIERHTGLNEAIFLLCLKGSGWIAHKDHHSSLIAPSFAWIPTDTPHRYAANADSPWSLAWVHLSGSALKDYMPLMGKPLSAHSILQPELARDRFERIFSLCHARHSHITLFNLHTELTNWLAGLASSNENMASKGDPRRQKLDLLLRFLRENCYRHVSLSEMARFTDWTPNHLSNVFRQMLKDSPASYFLHMKMARACDLLRRSDKPISHIADSLGYTDAFYFSRAFRRCYNISPRDYRKTFPPYSSHVGTLSVSKDD